MLGEGPGSAVHSAFCRQAQERAQPEHNLAVLISYFLPCRWWLVTRTAHRVDRMLRKHPCGWALAAAGERDNAATATLETTIDGRRQHLLLPLGSFSRSASQDPEAREGLLVTSLGVHTQHPVGVRLVMVDARKGTARTRRHEGQRRREEVTKFCANQLAGAKGRGAGRRGGEVAAAVLAHGHTAMATPLIAVRATRAV